MPEGWGWPGLASKPHYFAAGSSTSLCGRWMYTGPREPHTGTTGPKDCQACVRKLAKLEGPQND